MRPFAPFVWETSAIATFALLPALVWCVDRRPWSRGLSVAPIGHGSAELDLDAARILAVRAAGNYVEIFGVGERPLLVRAALAEVEERVAPLGIRRVHRSWLVALDRVERVSTTSAGDFRLELTRDERGRLPRPPGPECSRKELAALDSSEAEIGVSAVAW